MFTEIDLIYCADNLKYSEMALKAGYLIGLRLPNKVHIPPFFVDQDWRNPNRNGYLTLLREHKPKLATVLDWESDNQLEDVLSWAEEAACFVDSVIIIPKVHGGISRLPRTIGGKEIRLGYSVPTKYGGTDVFLGEFIGWPIHALGGSPKRQMELTKYLNVRSADGNYIHHKIKHAQFFDGHRWIQLSKAGYQVQGQDIPKTVLELSLPNLMLAWQKVYANTLWASVN